MQWYWFIFKEFEILNKLKRKGGTYLLLRNWVINFIKNRINTRADE